MRFSLGVQRQIRTSHEGSWNHSSCKMGNLQHSFTFFPSIHSAPPYSHHWPWVRHPDHWRSPQTASGIIQANLGMLPAADPGVGKISTSPYLSPHQHKPQPAFLSPHLTFNTEKATSSLAFSAWEQSQAGLQCLEGWLPHPLGQEDCTHAQRRPPADRPSPPHTEEGQTDTKECFAKHLQSPADHIQGLDQFRKPTAWPHGLPYLG